MLIRAILIATLLTSPACANGYGVGDTFEDPLQIARESVSAYELIDEGRPGLAIDVSTDFFGNVTILMAETGFADDSVRGERMQYVLSPDDEGLWTLIYLRHDVLCQRGANTVTWQTDLCP